MNTPENQSLSQSFYIQVALVFLASLCISSITSPHAEPLLTESEQAFHKLIAAAPAKTEHGYQQKALVAELFSELYHKNQTTQRILEALTERLDSILGKFFITRSRKEQNISHLLYSARKQLIKTLPDKANKIKQFINNLHGVSLLRVRVIPWTKLLLSAAGIGLGGYAAHQAYKKIQKSAGVLSEAVKLGTDINQGTGELGRVVKHTNRLLHESDLAEKAHKAKYKAAHSGSLDGYEEDNPSITRVVTDMATGSDSSQLGRVLKHTNSLLDESQRSLATHRAQWLKKHPGQESRYTPPVSLVDVITEAHQGKGTFGKAINSASDIAEGKGAAGIMLTKLGDVADTIASFIGELSENAEVKKSIIELINNSPKMLSAFLKILENESLIADLKRFINVIEKTAHGQNELGILIRHGLIRAMYAAQKGFRSLAGMNTEALEKFKESLLHSDSDSDDQSEAGSGGAAAAASPSKNKKLSFLSRMKRKKSGASSP